MNELLAFSVLSFVWGFILWVCGNLIEHKVKIAGVGFCIQIVGSIFIVAPFVIAAIGASAFIITGFAKTIPALI